MANHPRTRPVLRWCTTAALAAVLLLWLVSGGWYLWRVGTHTAWSVNGGVIGFGWFGADHGVIPGWTVAPTPEFNLLPTLPDVGRIGGTGTGWFISIPLWLVIAPLAILAALLWWRDARIRRINRAGLCPVCTYDRTGLSPESVCPECGASPTAPRPSSAA